jgi:TonB-linked SusC/RagA family outer membrane protein
MMKNLPSPNRWCLAIICLFVNVYVIQAQDVRGSAVQSLDIRGIVKDSAGAALPGVTVSVKDKPNVGTTTDLNGKYVLTVPNINSILVFSMVGYENQELPIKGKEVINIVIKRSSSSLNDVVVIAFGKQKKRDIIGSVTSISPAELKIPSSNLTNALAGRMAGIIAYQRSGEPGQDNAEFFIRGVTTFGYKKDPLILIDGIEYTTTELARLQPDDIASFSIMKDATATALYGARGANGVILVTTKEGKTGVARISFRVENSISQPTKNVELADPVTYMRLENEANATRGNLILPYSQSKIENTEAGTNKWVYPATDWKEMLFRNYTMNQRGNFNVSGGGQIARYYISGAFTKDNGILKVDKRNNFNSNIDLKTYVLRSNVNINVTKTTEAIVRLHGTFDDYKGPVDGGTGMYRKAMRANPVLFPAYYPVDDDHQFTNHILFGNYDRGSYLNPYADMVKGYKEESRSLMLAQFEVKQDLSFFTKGLAFRAMMNTNRESKFNVSRQYIPFYYSIPAATYDKLNNTYHLYPINPDLGTDYLDYSEGRKDVVSTFYFESAVNYNQTFNDKHGISGLLVFMARNRLEGNASSLQTSLPSRNMGLSGRGTYSYNNTYFAEFNFGYNGSERFHQSHRFGFFPSAGLAWYVSNEPFFDKLHLPVSKLKLRATYGLVGNDAIGDKSDRFFYLSEVNMNASANGATFGTDGGYSRNGISVSRYDNQNITWETAAKSNFAVELGLFNKIEIIAEYFREKRYNILMSRAIPSTFGLQGLPPKANVGEARAHGVDISFDYSDRFGKDWIFTSRFNFTYSTSAYDVYEEVQYDEPWLSHVGRPLSQQRGYIAERLFVDDEEVRSSPVQNFGNSQTRGGDIKFRDVNGDGQITILDQVYIGYPTTPEIIYGFGVSAKYKNVDISTFFQGSARSSFWIDVAATSPFTPYFYDGESIGNVPGTTFPIGVVLQNQLLKAYADSHWSEENRNLYALWPRLAPYVVTNNWQRSTWFMRDGAFLRLKQVEMGFTLPARLAKRMHMDNLRIYANATNLLTFSKFKLWDVEMAGNGLGYPIQKVINVGLNLSF